MAGTLLDFKYQNIRKRLELLLLALLSILALGQINFLAAYHVKRIDCTRDHRYSLGPETMAYIAKIPDHVTVIVTLSSQAKEPEMKVLQEDLRHLLEQYVYAGKQGGAQPKIHVEWVDVYQQRARAQTLMQQYHLQKENAILVICADRVCQISPAELYKAQGGEIRFFNAEAALTNAIAQVIAPAPPVVYFLEGHGEMRLDDTSATRGLSQLAHLMAARNITVRKLDLRGLVRIPEDAGAVVIAGPKGPMEGAQLELLSRYLDHAEGSLLVYLDPLSESGLDDLFERWGILADPWIVIDPQALVPGNNGECVLRRFAKHPITEPLLDYQLSVLGSLMRAVRADPARGEDDRLELAALIGCSAAAFAKRPAALQTGNALYFDPLKDLPGPLTVAMVSQRKLSGGLGLEVFRGRLVVFGDASLISNRSLQLIGNETLFLQTLNWMLKSADKMTIDPKKIVHYRLNLSGNELMAFGFCVACLALFFAIGALFMSWKRRI